jgi:hypothetical protein
MVMKAAKAIAAPSVVVVDPRFEAYHELVRVPAADASACIFGVPAPKA